MSKTKSGPHTVLRSHYSPSSRAAPGPTLKQSWGTLKERNRGDLCRVMFTADRDSGLPCLYFSLQCPMSGTEMPRWLICIIKKSWSIWLLMHIQQQQHISNAKHRLITFKYIKNGNFLQYSIVKIWEQCSTTFLNACRTINFGYAWVKSEGGGQYLQ